MSSGCRTILKTMFISISQCRRHNSANAAGFQISLQKAIDRQMVAGAALRNVREYSRSLDSLVLISSCASRQKLAALFIGACGASGAACNFRKFAYGTKARSSVIDRLTQMM